MKTILALLFSLYVGVIYAAPPVMETPFTDKCAQGGRVTVSTSAWTAVPTSACASRVGLYVTSLSTNTAVMNATGDSAAPTLDITIAPIILEAGKTQWHKYNAATILYLRSRATASEDVDYLEMKQ